jgi:hypothetical protein
MTMSGVAKVEVEARTIYEFGKRKRRVFDARFGEFRATKPTKKEAIAAVLADVGYVATARREEAHGCKLYPQGVNEWCFVLPSGGSMCFGAFNFAEALMRVKHDYADHEGCQAFFAAVESPHASETVRP